MNPNFSAYLDVVRFLAALLVFLGHAAGKNWTGGFLWQLGAYGQTAVIIFFVLSGFVIRHVVCVKEKTWQVFTASRVSRLWSVVIPALLVTFVIDTIGVKVAPDLYIGKPWFAGDHLWLRYTASLLLVHQAWGADLYPGINIPFWSLSFEFFYYILFGVLIYLSAYPRYFVFAAVALLAGPLIVAMFPIWWLGVLIYDHKERFAVPRYPALIMAAGGLLVLGLRRPGAGSASATWRHLAGTSSPPLRLHQRPGLQHSFDWHIFIVPARGHPGAAHAQADYGGCCPDISAIPHASAHHAIFQLRGPCGRSKLATPRSRHIRHFAMCCLADSPYRMAAPSHRESVAQPDIHTA